MCILRVLSLCLPLATYTSEREEYMNPLVLIWWFDRGTSAIVQKQAIVDLRVVGLRRLFYLRMLLCHRDPCADARSLVQEGIK